MAHNGPRTGAKGRPPLPMQGAETCGGVMFRGPETGDGARLCDYSEVVPLFGMAGRGREMPGNDAGLPGDGRLAGRPWSGAGGRWLLWPLRVALWATLLIIAYRGVTAIFFGQPSVPQDRGPEPAGASLEVIPQWIEVGCSRAAAARLIPPAVPETRQVYEWPEAV